MHNGNGKILVLGASGYIGTQLVPRLLDAGYAVVAAGHHLAKLQEASWAQRPGVRLCAIDALDRNSLLKAAEGCVCAYYLIHSMTTHNDFETIDRTAAENAADAAFKQGIQRIIFLGGLGEKTSRLSKHLRSRMEVSEILHNGRVAVTTLRAAMIIGAGSISFEIIRYLVEHFPVLVTTGWIHTQSQPIAIENTVNYLIGALEHPECSGQVYDIGGPETLSYRHLMEMFSEEMRLRKRVIISLPFLPMKFNSFLIESIAPFPTPLVHALAESLLNPVVCLDNRIQDIVPQKLLSPREAIRSAIRTS